MGAPIAMTPFLIKHAAAAIKGDSRQLAEALTSVENAPIVDQETVAKATENVRQLYGGGLPSYQEPIWDILAPIAMTPFLIKHAAAAIKGDSRQLAEALTSSMDKDTKDAERRLLDVPVIRRFWQSVGDSWTCMAEHMGDFLHGDCPKHKRRMEDEAHPVH